jgi:hypothetical protein
MYRLGVAALGIFFVGACESGAPPRNQADTLANTSTLPTAANPLYPTAPSSTTSSARSQGTTAIVTPKPDGVSRMATPEPNQEHALSPALPGSATSEHAPAPAFDPERACKKTADCAVVPDDCSLCPPCEATWRRAANRATVNRIVKARQAVECPPIYCEQCWTPPPPGVAPEPHGYLGDVAECRAGQCVVVGQ